MVRHTIKITACVVAAAITFSGMGLTANAAVTSSVLPSGGVDLTLAMGNKLETIATNYINPSVSIETIIEELDIATSDENRASAEDEVFRNLVIAQVNAYVNIRNMPSEEGEVVGKLYDDSVGTLISEENGWYQITSGSVTGYVKAEYCVTGDAAVELARQVGTRIATVTTTTLYVRQEPTTESSVIWYVPIDDQLVVFEETEGWAKVDTEVGMGWISKEFATMHTEFVEAESKEEEEARLAKEAEERRKAREAAAAKAAQDALANAAVTNDAPATTTTTTTATVGEGSEMGVAVAEYALQFVGNPYVYGGSSLTNGTDCSGFVMSVYANFGVSLPHSSAADRTQGSAVDGLANAQPGDLVCYSGHVALYIGNGQIVHASTAKTGIIVSNADYKKVLAVRRIF